MELRHLRYFVAVAELGSMTVAAERRLHTAQPSLSRQIRDLEAEVAATLLKRSPHGIELTAAGRAFLDHARLALAQAEAAGEAARRVARPERTLSLGFLSGEDVEWLPEAMCVLRNALPHIEVKIISGHSPDIADAVSNRKVDVAFIRPERPAPDLEYKLLRQEPLFAVLPSDHRLNRSNVCRSDSVRRRKVHWDFRNSACTASDRPGLRSDFSGRDDFERRGRLYLDGRLFCCVNAWCGAAANLRTEPSPLGRGRTPNKRNCPDGRSRLGPSQGKRRAADPASRVQSGRDGRPGVSAIQRPAATIADTTYSSGSQSSARARNRIAVWLRFRFRRLS